MRSLLQALASVGLASAPFVFPIVVMAEMAAPTPSVEAQPDVERFAVLLLSPSPSPSPPPSPMDEPVEDAAPDEVQQASGGTGSGPNIVDSAPKMDNVSPKKENRSPKKTKKKRSCLPDEDGIRQVGERTWEVERAVVAPYATPSRAEELAWTAWHRDAGGEIDGFVVKHMRCGSVLRQAGFKNGDVVLAVNGNPITTLLQGFNTWRKVRGDDRFRVKVKRRDGSTEVLRFTLL